MEEIKKDTKEYTEDGEEEEDDSIVEKQYRVKKKTRGRWEKFECKFLFYTQYVEYKVSHYIDKAFETMFGFVSVLPGAFCTFRWEAIQGDPLKSFFKGLDSDKHSAKEANMYLAEDRVMCLEILRKYSSHWVLRYVPGCLALTDPPTSIVELIKQRRRWTNGSLFASWYVIDHLNLITRAGHSCGRQVLLFILYAYMTLNFVFSLMLVGSLFASYFIFIEASFDEESSLTKTVLFGIYPALIIIFIIMSITKPIEVSTASYTIMVILFCTFIFISLILGLSSISFYEAGQSTDKQITTFIGGVLVVGTF